MGKLELVGLAEAAELLGIPSTTLVARRRRPGRKPRSDYDFESLRLPARFPATVAELRCGPIWLRADIVDYGEEVERRRTMRLLDLVMLEEAEEAAEAKTG